TLASAGRDHTVRLWNIDTGEDLVFPVPRGWIYYMLFEPAGPVVVTWRDDTSEISVWDVRQSEERASFATPPDTVHSVTMSSDAQVLAAACDDGSLHVWDIARNRLRFTWRGDGSPLTALAYSPDGRFLASGARDGVVKLWDDQTSKQVATLEG